MKQAQEMQQKMQQAQEEMANAEFEGQAGAGMVRVIMTGRHDVRRVHIDDAVLQEEKSVLEDLLAAAVNDAVKKVESSNQNALGGLLPAGFKMPF
jgi:DNA-binding YbaB/EbfC family protein